MQCFIELNMFGITYTIYCDLVCRANGGGGWGNVSIKWSNAVAIRSINICMVKRLLLGYTGCGDQLKDDERPYNKL